MAELDNSTEIVTHIRAVKAEIQRLEAEVERLKGVLREAFVELRQDLGDDTTSRAPQGRRTSGMRPARQRPIRENSSVGWARKVLQQVGEPLEAGVLALMIKDRSGTPTKKATLVSNLARYVSQGDTFTRPRPGYYGLKEFEGE